jgi:hypothetical protein
LNANTLPIDLNAFSEINQMGGGVAPRPETLLFQENGKNECGGTLAVGTSDVDNFGGVFWVTELVQQESNAL